MSKPVTIKSPDKLLDCESAVSDRFCYSRQFIPRELHVIPAAHQADLDRILDGLLRKTDPAFNGKISRVIGSNHEVVGFQDLAARLRNREAPVTEWPKLLGIIQSDPVRKLLKSSKGRIPNKVQFGANPPDLAAWEEFNDAQQLLDLLKSEIGYLFYDRTRIRPIGFQIGEHLFALSLAPGEEAIIEQKSWTKRELSLDQMLELEKAITISLDSTFTTDIQENLDDVKKAEANMTGTLGGNIDPLSLMMAFISPETIMAKSEKGGGPVTANASAQPTIKLSDEMTQKQSTKNIFTHTNKITALSRSLHKTTFTVNSETYAENTSKHTITNPNPTTPINLHYFKILSKHEVSHERYGARLCWSPWIKDPGANLRAQATDANGSTGVPLQPPVKPEMRTWKMSDWGYPTGIDTAFDACGGLSIDSDDAVSPLLLIKHAEIGIPKDWEWDGRQENVELELVFTGNREHMLEKKYDAYLSHNVGIFQNPTAEEWFVFQQYHVGIACTTSTIAGKLCRAKNQASRSCDHMNCNTDEPVYSADAGVKMRVGLNPVYTAEERAILDEYEKQKAEWEQSITQQNEPSPDADDEQEVPAVGNPLSELMRRLVDFYFVREERDDSWEIEYWHHIFDWGDAAYTLYPGWWTGELLPFPSLSPTHLLNASWARMYIPIRTGYERLALRWIIGYNFDLPLSEGTEAEIAGIVKELEDYRNETFGDPHEELIPANGNGELTAKYKVMGCWTELLPTDGTHLEILQSGTSVGDG